MHRGCGTEPLSRRDFLLWGAAGAASLALPARARAVPRRPREEPPGTLAFYNTHTGEHLRVAYRNGNRYDRQALKAIDHVLRDHRTGETRPIDTDLLDLLHTLHRKLGAREPFHVISGYRSPRTNEMLRARGRGVARRSMHLVGKAVDIRIPGCPLTLLRDAALAEQAGGVGTYPGPGFVHVDVGPVRRW